MEIEARDRETVALIEAHLPFIKRFANYREITFGGKAIETTGKALVVYPALTVAVPMAQLVNIEEEKAKLRASLEKTEAEIARCRSLLSNEKFIQKAPADKIAIEREKLADYLKQKEEIERLLSEYEK